VKHPSPKVQAVREEASEHLAAIQAMFVPGAKVSLLVRHPSHPDGTRDFYLTDDTIPEVIAALHLLSRRPEL
jgi:hypothetical protein